MNNAAPSPTRRYRSREERRQTVAAWRSSGQTRSDFARSHGLNPKSLSRWIVEADADPADGARPSGFIPALPPAAGGAVRWLLPGGLGVVTATVPEHLARLLQAVLGSDRP